MSAAATANRLFAVYGGLDRSGYQLPSRLLHYRRSRGRHSTLSRHFLMLFLLLLSNIRRLPGGVISLPLRLLLIRQGRGEFVFVAHDRRTRRTAIDVAAVAMAANTHGLAATLADVASMAVPVTTTIFYAHWPKWPPGNWTDEASSAIIRLAVIRNCFGGGAHCLVRRVGAPLRRHSSQSQSLQPARNPARNRLPFEPNDYTPSTDLTSFAQTHCAIVPNHTLHVLLFPAFHQINAGPSLTPLKARGVRPERQPIASTAMQEP